MNYSSRRILDSDLIVCIVASAQPTPPPRITLNNAPNRLTGREGSYRLNLALSCSFNGVPSTSTSSLFKIAPRGFLDPTNYLFSEGLDSNMPISDIDNQTINYLDGTYYKYLYIHRI